MLILGMYKKAVLAYAYAFNISDELDYNDSLLTGLVLVYSGLNLFYLGNTEDGMKYLKNGDVIVSKYKENESLRIEMLYIKGIVLYFQKKYEESTEIFHECYDLYKNIYPKSHPNRGMVMCRAGILYT